MFNLEVRPEDFDAYVIGTSAQDAFPYLSPEERELIISQTCSECWEHMFDEDMY